MKRVVWLVLLCCIGAGVVFVGLHYGWRSYQAAWRAVAGPRKRKLRVAKFERTEARRQRGEYLVNGVLGCFHCHSDRDWTQDGFPIVPGTIGAGHDYAQEGFPGLVMPNITPDIETGAGSWTDDMLARAIREGIGHDGRALIPTMPYQSFRKLSDEDTAAVVVYLRSIPEVHRVLPKMRRTLAQRFRDNSLPEPIMTPIPQPTFRTLKDKGEYLEFLADCAGCHTDWYHPGSAVNAKLFAGGNEFPDAHGGRVFSPNLTPDPSGIPYYDEAFFIQVIRTGRVGARPLNGLMPWVSFRNMNDDDLRAVFAWLQAQEPVKHIVDNTEPPTYCKRCYQIHGGGENN
jgi:hypothetical protein